MSYNHSSVFTMNNSNGKNGVATIEHEEAVIKVNNQLIDAYSGECIGLCFIEKKRKRIYTITQIEISKQRFLEIINNPNHKDYTRVIHEVIMDMDDKVKSDKCFLKLIN